MSNTMSPIPSATTFAISVDTFDGRSRLGEAHQALTNFLHYQSHVRFAAAASLPPHILAADNNKWKEIIWLLNNETRALNTLKKLINAIRANNKELEESYAATHPEATWGDQWTAQRPPGWWHRSRPLDPHQQIQHKCWGLTWDCYSEQFWPGASVTTHGLQYYEYLICWTGTLTFTSYSLLYDWLIWTYQFLYPLPYYHHRPLP